MKQSSLSVFPYVVIVHMTAKFCLGKFFLLSFCDKKICVQTFPWWLFSCFPVINYILAFMVHKYVINFVADGWDKIFLTFCIFEQRKKILWNRTKWEYGKIEELRISLHLTHLLEQKHCDVPPVLIGDVPWRK